MKKFISIIFINSIVFCFGNTNYVSLTGMHVSPFDSWQTASTNIQNAIDVAIAGNIVLVDSGLYSRVRGDIADESSGSMLTITNAIKVIGLYGAEFTKVDAIGYHQRNLYINHDEAVFSGFELVGGWARTNLGEQVFPVSVGGAIFSEAGMIENCIISWGRAGLDASKAYLSNSIMRNCLIDASGGFNGDAIKCIDSNIESCTIFSYSTNEPQILRVEGNSLIINTIIYNKSFPNSNIVVIAPAQVMYSCSQDMPLGPGNIKTDPLLVSNNWKLTVESPCINAGTNETWMLNAKDINGNLRISKEIVDIGVHEMPGVYYVSTHGKHIAPYFSLENAATNLKAVLDIAYNNTVIFVDSGEYSFAENILLNKTVHILGLHTNNLPIFKMNNYKITQNANDGIMENLIISEGKATAVSLRAGIIRGCIFKNNYSDEVGSALSMEAGLVDACTFINNSSKIAGGAINIGGGIIRNSVIAENYCEGIEFMGITNTGGGAIIINGNATFENCTIVNNFSDNCGGAILFLESESTKFFNCIIANNYAKKSGNDFSFAIEGIASAAIYNSVVESGFEGLIDAGGNITNNPKLSGLEVGIYRLEPDSPCINAGTNLPWMTENTQDYSGAARIYNEIVDIGACEFQNIFYVAETGMHIIPFDTIAKAATNIIDAINLVENASYLKIESGNYKLSQKITMLNNITISGADNFTTVLDADNQDFYIENSNLKKMLIKNIYLKNYNGKSAFKFGAGAIKNCKASNCQGDMGAAFNARGTARLSQCYAISNSAIVGGGFIFSENAMAENCVAFGNSAIAGAGVALLGNSEIRNFLIAENFQTGTFTIPGENPIGGGGGIILPGSDDGIPSSAKIQNCTIVNNYSEEAGAGIYAVNFLGTSSNILINNIIANNKKIDEQNDMEINDAELWLQNNCISTELPIGIIDGGGNVITNLIFAENSWYLLENSPGIEYGIYLSWMRFNNDLDGIFMGALDKINVGAYQTVLPEPIFLGLLLGSLLFFRRR